MPSNTIEALAHKATQLAEALEAAAAGMFETESAKMVFSDQGPCEEFAPIKIYQTDSMIAVWTPDKTMQVHDIESYGAAPTLHLESGCATF